MANPKTPREDKSAETVEAPELVETVEAPKLEGTRTSTATQAHEALTTNVIKEFEIEGKAAKIIRVTLDDISDEDLSAHALNLAKANFKLLPDIQDAVTKAAKRQALFISNNETSEAELNAIYPDYTEEEHFRAYKQNSFPKYIEAGTLLGVQIGGRIVSVQAYSKTGTAEKSGRPVFEFTKASTIDEEQFREKGLNKGLKKEIYKEVMETNPKAMWISASIDPEHLERMKKRGWTITDLDDSHEAIQVMYNNNESYMKDVMIPQGYKGMYFDPEESREMKWN